MESDPQPSHLQTTINDLTRQLLQTQNQLEQTEQKLSKTSAESQIWQKKYEQAYEEIRELKSMNQVLQNQNKQFLLKESEERHRQHSFADE